MAIIKPFRGIRPPQDLVEQVVSRPYDVLNSAEARAEAGDNEKSLYHIIKPEIDFLKEQMNMTLGFILRRHRISKGSSRKDGWFRIRKTAIISMRKP